jgi:Flp pilus assembly protein TadG
MHRRQEQQLLTSEGGAAAVEMALVASLFFFLLFAGIDYSWAVFGKVRQTNAVAERARFMALGSFVNGASASNCVLDNGPVATPQRDALCTLKQSVADKGGTADFRARITVMNRRDQRVRVSAPVKGDQVVVCLIAPVPSLSGITKTLNAGKMQKIRMSNRLEGAYTFGPLVTEAAPPGTNWDFCDTP